MLTDFLITDKKLVSFTLMLVVILLARHQIDLDELKLQNVLAIKVLS